MDCGTGRTAPSSSDFPFHYKGAVTLSDGTHHVDLANVELWEERECVEVGGEALEVGVRSWHGVGQAVQVPRRLFDLLGGEVSVRLADGRLGHAYVTGYCDESLWVVEITGVGHVPNLNTI
jgi:hypothetical protein